MACRAKALKPLPDLSEFRASIKIKGRSLTDELLAMRREERYMHYLDTSVLTGYYCVEERSKRVQRALSEMDCPTISPLVEVEFYCTVARKVRAGAMGQPTAVQVFSEFRMHVAEPEHNLLPISRPTMSRRANGSPNSSPRCVCWTRCTWRPPSQRGSASSQRTKNWPAAPNASGWSAG